MEDMIKQVAQQVGISEEQAKQAVETIMSALKDKLPDEVMGQISSMVGNLGDMAEDAGSAAKDIAGDASSTAQGEASDTADKADDVVDDLKDMAGDAIDNIKKGLGGLFGGKDD